MQNPFSTQPELFITSGDLGHASLQGLDGAEAVLDWQKLEQIMAGIYASKTGRPSYPLLTLFRASLLGIWYRLSDVELAQTLFRDLLFRKFCHLELGGDVPDATTIGRFRQKLVEHDLWEVLLVEVTRKKNRLYRYYVSQTVLKHGAGTCPVGRVPAGEIETAVIDQLRAVFRQPEIIIATWKATKPHDVGITEAEAREALTNFDPLWDELFPAEQARIIQLLLERVDIGLGGLDVRLRIDGLGNLVRELITNVGKAA